METGFGGRTVGDILRRAERQGNVAVSVKNQRGAYTYANERWSCLAEAPAHTITGKRDDQLPWGSRNGAFIRSLDFATKQDGYVKRTDRLTHFNKNIWTYTTTERVYVPDEDSIVCIVALSEFDEFCRLASLVDESGIAFNQLALSVRQLHLLHQLLFHVPHAQTARELGCSLRRLNRELRELRDDFAVDDQEGLIRAVSLKGLLPLIEHLDLLFKYRWVPAELKFS